MFLLVIFVGIAGPITAGVLLTGLVHGRAGLHDLRSRLFKWRVNVRWYAIALLTAPLLTLAIMFSLSLSPAIVTTADKAGLLLPAILASLMVPFCEEMGWTGFAMPELRKNYGILATGLIMGLLWGAWHFPLFSGSMSSSGVVPPGLYLAILIFSWLVPYRVLMVWVYDRTKSLLLVMLMHAPIVFGSFALLPSAISGLTNMLETLSFTAALWLVVAAAVAPRKAPLAEVLPDTSISKEEPLSPLARHLPVGE
jgi:membrane protease YdiL (CAAX protease family)